MLYFGDFPALEGRPSSTTDGPCARNSPDESMHMLILPEPLCQGRVDVATLRIRAPFARGPPACSGTYHAVPDLKEVLCPKRDRALRKGPTTMQSRKRLHPPTRLHPRVTTPLSSRNRIRMRPLWGPTSAVLPMTATSHRGPSYTIPVGKITPVWRSVRSSQLARPTTPCGSGSALRFFLRFHSPMRRRSLTNSYLFPGGSRLGICLPGSACRRATSLDEEDFHEPERQDQAALPSGYGL